MGLHSARVPKLEAEARKRGSEQGWRLDVAAQYLVQTRTEAAQRSASALRTRPAAEGARGRSAGELRNEATPIRQLDPITVQPANTVHFLPIRARVRPVLWASCARRSMGVPAQRAAPGPAAAHRRGENGVGGGDKAQISPHRRWQALRPDTRASSPRNSTEAERQIGSHDRAERGPISLSAEGSAEGRIQAAGRLEPVQ